MQCWNPKSSRSGQFSQCASKSLHCLASPCVPLKFLDSPVYHRIKTFQSTLQLTKQGNHRRAWPELRRNETDATCCTAMCHGITSTTTPPSAFRSSRSPSVTVRPAWSPIEFTDHPATYTIRRHASRMAAYRSSHSHGGHYCSGTAWHTDTLQPVRSGKNAGLDLLTPLVPGEVAWHQARVAAAKVEAAAQHSISQNNLMPLAMASLLRARRR